MNNPDSADPSARYRPRSQAWFPCLLALLCCLVVPLQAETETSAGGLEFGGVHIDKAAKTVTFPAEINMTDGLMEYLIVTDMGKTHESLVSTKIAPFDIQVAMLLLGIKPAVKAEAEPPAQLNKQYLATAPELKGEKVNVYLAWKDDRGSHRARAEDMMWNLKENAPMKEGPWTYNGSEMYGGKFLAQVDGSIAALVRDSAALINNPRPGNDDDQIWQVNSKATPKVGTAVDVIIELVDDTVK